MTFKEISELLKLINELELTELKLRDGEFELSVRTKRYEKSKRETTVVSSQQPVIPVPAVPPTVQQQAVAQPQAPAGESGPAAPPAAPTEKAAEEGLAGESNLLEIRSPIVGTFYRSPAPEKPPYVKVGDTVDVGSVVCIVEAMKLFNEIESEIGGKIVKVMVEDAQPVEYDQVLFLVEPAG
jgi:acetyl-CoA carboxylase biotin carboxyl carrier protein